MQMDTLEILDKIKRSADKEVDEGCVKALLIELEKNNKILLEKIFLVQFGVGVIYLSAVIYLLQKILRAVL